MNCQDNTTPCTSCGQTDACGCKTSTADVVYKGPNLSCTGINNCDTLTTVLQKIDGFICGPGMVETIIYNITNNTELYLQFQTIVNNTVDCQTVWTCIENSTTTTTTTECPCTYYTFVGGRSNPAHFTFVACGDTEPSTIIGGDTPVIHCVSNHYPVIQIGNGTFTNTHDCCVPSTTTTTTTLPLAYCYEIAITNRCSVYWTDVNGVAQIESGTNTTIFICAQPGTIASACEDFGSISISGGTVECLGEASCQPSTTTTTSTSHTTTTTTTTCACQSYDITITSLELNLADGKTIYAAFDDCFGDSQQYEYTVAGVYRSAFCAGQTKTPLGYYITGGVNVVDIAIQPTSAGCCVPNCTEYTVAALPGDGTWTAIDCSGFTRSGSIEYPGNVVLDCMRQGTLNLTNAIIVSERDCPL